MPAAVRGMQLPSLAVWVVVVGRVRVVGIVLLVTC
jgi:hypothetical protein